MREVTTLLVLLHGLRISTIATFDVTLSTMSNDMHFLSVGAIKA